MDLLDGWTEYRWFNTLEEAIKYLTQKRLTEREGCFNFEKFLLEYKKTMQAVESKFEQQGFVLAG